MNDSARLEEPRPVPATPPISFDELVSRLGGWGVILSMFLALGGKLTGLPPSAQDFLAKRLEEEKLVKTAKEGE